MKLVKLGIIIMAISLSGWVIFTLLAIRARALGDVDLAERYERIAGMFIAIFRWVLGRLLGCGCHALWQAAADQDW
jgi:hypothetical protein